MYHLLRVPLFSSFHRKYGRLYSLKIGDYKIVVATSGEAIYEALVKKSLDFSGRPPLHGLMVQTLGTYLFFI